MAVLLTLVALAAGNTVWLRARRATHFFSFEPFEGNGSLPRIDEAKVALERIVRPGSTMADYDRFFRDMGGECAVVADAVRFPNTAMCSYDHGFLVSAGWRYVFDYDPTTLRSKRTELKFGLTGP